MDTKWLVFLERKSLPFDKKIVPLPCKLQKMLKKTLILLTLFMMSLVLYAQDDILYENYAEDTVSSNFESQITCPTIDSIIQFAFYKKPTSKYKYGAAGPNHFDCSGFVYYCFNQFGITLPRSSRDMFLVGKKVAKEELIPGDLVFFSRGRLAIGHVGIVVETDIDAAHNFRFIHSSTNKTNIRVDNSASPGYAARFKGARRIISCENDIVAILPNDTTVIDTIVSKPIIGKPEIVQKPIVVQQQPVKAEVKSTKYHKIKKGETLSGIARKYHTSVSNLKKWNKLRSDFIREGQRIIVGK